MPRAKIKGGVDWPIPPFPIGETEAFCEDRILSPIEILRKRMCYSLGGPFTWASPTSFALREKLFHVTEEFRMSQPEAQAILDSGPEAIRAKAVELALLMS